MPDPRYVQLLNPRGWWVQIDREQGRIVGHRTDKWPGVPVVEKRANGVKLSDALGELNVEYWYVESDEG